MVLLYTTTLRCINWVQKLLRNINKIETVYKIWYIYTTIVLPDGGKKR